MSVLPDHRIEYLCRNFEMVSPFDSDLLNPASLDVRLGNTLLLEKHECNGFWEFSIESNTAQDPFMLKADQFVLAQTLEKFNVPSNVSGQFALKSSLARAGFEHLLAGWIDPGFTDSVLTLELKNAKQYSALPLWPGMRIGQIIFMNLQSMPRKSYYETGRYNHDHKVKGCKGLI